MTNVPFIPVSGVLGLAVGSFLNVCIDRLPAGQSLIKPPSHCSACNRRLATADLIPLFSYLWLRGRCRYCRASISPRLPLVEGLTSLAFAFLCWHYDLTLQLFFSLVYASLFIVIFFIDLEHQLVLNKIVYPAMALALAFSFFRPELGVVHALLGGAAGGAIMLLLFFITRGGLGMGDVKLMALLGLATGFPQILLALLLSVVVGGLVAILLLVSGLKKRRDAIPFAPFLVAGAFAVLLWGQAIYEWYLGLLQGIAF